MGILGVPLDLGGNHRGMDMGPYAVRHAGLMGRLRRLGYEVKDFGNVEVPVRDELDVGDPKARYLKEITEVSGRLSADYVGGDHSCSIGTVAGTACFRKGQPFGLLWVDAHGDLNVPETSRPEMCTACPCQSPWVEARKAWYSWAAAGPK